MCSTCNYIYVGEDGLKKAELALKHAKEVLNTTNLNCHPDFLLFGGRGEPVRTEAAEDIQEFISSAPAKSLSKVVLIRDAHLSTPEFQQAILKLLEEGSKCCVFLITTERHLLDTIHSRCVTKQVKRWSEDAMQLFARDNSISLDSVALALAGGRPGVYEYMMSPESAVFLEDVHEIASLVSTGDIKNIFINLSKDSWMDAHSQFQCSLVLEFIQNISMELLYGQINSGERECYNFLNRKKAVEGVSITALLTIAERCIDDRFAIAKKGLFGKNELFSFAKFCYNIL